MLSEFRSTNITWDKATSRIYSPVTANESDENGRKLVVQIVNGGQVEDLTGSSLHLYWATIDKFHDGLDVFKAVDLKKGEFELSYTAGMLSNKGVLNANLVLINTTGRVVSERFKIIVTEGINNDKIQSEDSFTSLTRALIDIVNLEQNYAPRLNELSSQLTESRDSLNSTNARLTSVEINKRDKNVKLTHSDLDTSTDANKLKLLNLSDEVKRAMAGNTPINSSVADGGVGTTKLADAAVTSAKRTELGITGFMVCFDPDYSYVDFDTESSVVTIPRDTTVFWEKSKFTTPTDADTVISFEPSGNLQMLYFNTLTKTFRCLTSWSIGIVKEEEIILAAFSVLNKTVTCNAQYSINGKTFFSKDGDITTSKLANKAVTTKKRTVLGTEGMMMCFDSTKKFVDFDYVAQTITIPANTSVIWQNNEYNISEDVVVNMYPDKNLQLLYFNAETYTFRCIPNNLTWDVKESEILLSASNYLKTVICNAPYGINGVPYGDKADTTDEPTYVNSFDDNIRVSAHRGYIATAPENTLLSFERAKDEGFAYIEFDVRFTSDNVPVILHDPTINRTARNADGTSIADPVNIADITYDQALSYDFGIFKDPSYAGTKIPTLGQTFNLCRMLNIRPYIHVNVATESQLANIFTLVKRYGLKRKSVWVMNGVAAATGLLNLDSGAVVGVSASASTASIDELVNLKNTFDNEHIYIDTYLNEMTVELADYCHDNDLNFGAFTASNPSLILTAVERGATSLTVDNINVQQLLAEHYRAN